MTTGTKVGNLAPRAISAIDSRLTSLKDDLDRFANQVDQVYLDSDEYTEVQLLDQHVAFLDYLEALRSDVEYAMQRIEEEFALDRDRNP